mmetsp:Transcript_13613/g.27030  ORF Transcript_13613/g.27030 Transcript_13613/m.27030 type:complete len:230 (+) Transcript_13613:891-1580(+)
MFTNRCSADTFVLADEAGPHLIEFGKGNKSGASMLPPPSLSLSLSLSLFLFLFLSMSLPFSLVQAPLDVFMRPLFFLFTSIENLKRKCVGGSEGGGRRVRSGRGSLLSALFSRPLFFLLFHLPSLFFFFLSASVLPLWPVVVASAVCACSAFNKSSSLLFCSTWLSCLSVCLPVCLVVGVLRLLFRVLPFFHSSFLPSCISSPWLSSVLERVLRISPWTCHLSVQLIRS